MKAIGPNGSELEHHIFSLPGQMETSEEAGTATAATAGTRKSEQNQRRTLFGPRPVNLLGRRASSPNPPSAAPQSFRRLNYVATSAPLEIQKEVPSGTQSSSRSRDEIDLDEFDDMALTAPRRSLLVRVVDVLSGMTLIPPNSDLRANTNAGSLQSQAYIAPLLKAKLSNPSFQSVGDYSRYPEWPHTGAGPPILSPVFPEWNDGDSVRQSSVNPNFREQDPERGFSPYLEGGGIAVQYPTIDEKEEDDDIHNPDPNEVFRPSYKRAFLGVLCILVVICGVFLSFIVWPVLQHTGYGRLDRGRNTVGPIGEGNLSNLTYPILSAARISLIDPDTPQHAMTRDSVLGGGKLKLVFSDEFNKNGRSFYENDDPFWQAVDLHYTATNNLEWYDPDAVTTKDGNLRLRLDAFKNHDLDYRSGMLQSWNKLCFKGGVLEVSVSLPAPAGVPGLWPGVWALGNLARPGYMSTADGVWPYAYDECDAGITPNQSSSDGISFLPGQKFPKCICEGEEHPSPGRGRGAPEIDVFEAGAGSDSGRGVVTQSSQIVYFCLGQNRVHITDYESQAPFDILYKPNYEFLTISNPEITWINGYRGGPFQQAISSTVLSAR